MVNDEDKNCIIWGFH